MKVGILVLVAVLLLIFGYNFLKGQSLFETDRVFYVVYDQVEGLAPSAPVTINGLTVGNVKDIKFQGDDGKLLVTLRLNNDFQFSKNSVAKIYSAGFIGGKSLGIFPSYTGEIAQDGDYLSGEVVPDITDAIESKLLPLQDKVESMIVSADSVMTSVKLLLNESTRSNIQASIAGLNSTVRSYQTLANNFNTFMTENQPKLNHTIANLDTTTEIFSKLSDSLSQIQIGALVSEMETTLAGFTAILDDVNNGEGNLGKLLYDEQLYTNIEGASRQLEQLLQDFKLNPKRYIHFSVFGKQPGEYEAPENPDQ